MSLERKTHADNPTGVIFPFGGAAAPSGYLLCNGAAVSRTTYAALFAVVSDAYGVGDGSTTFNTPNLAGKIPVGIGASGVTNLGDAGGEQNHTLITSEMPEHDHNQMQAGAVDRKCTAYADGADTGVGLGDNNTSSVTRGGDGAHQNMQPYVGTEYIIKT